jgi:hypothetical protein
LAIVLSVLLRFIASDLVHSNFSNTPFII